MEMRISILDIIGCNFIIWNLQCGVPYLTVLLEEVCFTSSHPSKIS